MAVTAAGTEKSIFMSLIGSIKKLDLPKIGSTDSQRNPMLITAGCKVFGPGRYTYFVTEFDGDDIVFGYCVSPLGSDCDEWGSASVDEWVNQAGPYLIELDRFFKPTSVGSALRRLADSGLADMERYKSWSVR